MKFEQKIMLIMEKNTNKSAEWDKIITSNQSRFNLHLNRIWEYRDLIFLLVKRDFITYYKQTIFGPLWYLVQPILTTIMYMIVFGSLAKIGTDEIPQVLFYFSGTMLWTYFSGNLKDVSNTFNVNKNIFGKVFFPRIVAPIATTIGLLIKLGIQFILFAIIFLYYIIKGVNINISWHIALFPLIVLWLSVLSCGIGMIISAVTTKYKDLALMLDFLISLWLYATPIVYPLSEVPDSLMKLSCINPVSAPIELFRYCFFGICSVPIWAIILSIIVTIFLSMFGIMIFNRNEKTFVDVI